MPVIVKLESRRKTIKAPTVMVNEILQLDYLARLLGGKSFPAPPRLILFLICG